MTTEKLFIVLRNENSINVLNLKQSVNGAHKTKGSRHSQITREIKTIKRFDWAFVSGFETKKNTTACKKKPFNTSP